MIVGALEAIHHTGHVVGIARDLALVLARAQGVGETDPTHHMQGTLIGGAGNDPRHGQATVNPTKNYCVSPPPPSPTFKSDVVSRTVIKLKNILSSYCWTGRQEFRLVWFIHNVFQTQCHNAFCIHGNPCELSSNYRLFTFTPY